MKKLIFQKMFALCILTIVITACVDDSDDPPVPDSTPATENILPSASFVAPTPTTAISEGETITVAVNAEDSDGSIVFG